MGTSRKRTPRSAPREAGAGGRARAPAGPEGDDPGARPPRGRPGSVGRAVVHHEHRPVQPRALHDVGDGSRLVEGGYDDQDVARAVAHRAGSTTRAVRQPPRAIPCTSTEAAPRSASSAAAPTRSAPRPPCWPNSGASETGGGRPAGAGGRAPPA